jgi:hypothetical protein
MAQYSPAQIQHARRELEKWGLLDYLVDKAGEDAQKLTTRADVLVVSYEIVKELKTLDQIAEQNRSSVLNIQNNLQLLKDKTSTEDKINVSEELLIQKVTNEVFASLKYVPEITEIYKEIDKLKDLTSDEKYRTIDLNQAVNKEVEKSRKKANQAKIVAITSVGIASIMAILSAGVLDNNN